MAESLPLPQALRWLATDEEWRLLEPYLSDNAFPRGMESWLNAGDARYARAEALIDELEGRLAEALAGGRLTAVGQVQGRPMRIDARLCCDAVIGDDGTSLAVGGIPYSNVQISKPEGKEALGKYAQKRRQQSRIARALRPLVAQLEETGGQTSWTELRNHMLAAGLPLCADSLLQKGAAAAGVTGGMIKRGRPRKIKSEN